MLGKRVDEQNSSLLRLAPGEYGKFNGKWYARTPDENLGFGSLAQHDVTEHEDGTITVSPSIAVDDGTHSWHGFLEKGVWRSC